MQYAVQLSGQRSVFQVQIYNGYPIDPEKLIKFFTTKEAIQRGDVDPCLVALNTLMIYGFGLLYPHNKSSFFISDPNEVGLSTAHQPHNVEDGVELWRE